MQSICGLPCWDRDVDASLPDWFGVSAYGVKESLADPGPKSRKPPANVHLLLFPVLTRALWRKANKHLGVYGASVFSVLLMAVYTLKCQYCDPITCNQYHWWTNKKYPKHTVRICSGSWSSTLLHQTNFTKANDEKLYHQNLKILGIWKHFERILSHTAQFVLHLQAVYLSVHNSPLSFLSLDSADLYFRLVFFPVLDNL